MSLSDIEVRVLGSLLEKERTTPEGYPLSSNALMLACNQKTNREPVTDYGVLEVEEALRSLADKGLARSLQGSAERVVKHQHRLTEAFDLGAKEWALLALLMLRGPQTPGELRGRTERYVHFAEPAAVEASLTRLLEHHPPLVKNHGRRPGQSQTRWGHTLGIDPERQRPRVRQGDLLGTPTATSAPAPSTTGEVAALRAEVARLRHQVDRLMAHVGLSEDEA